MKKILVLMVAALMVFSASPGWAAPVLGPWHYASPVDSILAYEALDTASDAQEQAFVAGVLGISTEQLLATYGYVKQEGIFGGTALAGYNPGFAWVYAVVKVDGPNDFSYLFQDTQAAGGDDLLTTPVAGTTPYNMGTPALGISHVSFFTTTAVPEPLTMLLLGLGLVGLAGVGRFKK